jgi:DnaJ-class molecular chaperone
MDRRSFLAAASALVAASCARDEKRAPRYDDHECPFCTQNKGVCSYCNGTKKCPFCKGIGKRKIVVPDFPDKNIKSTSYEETCVHCEGTGVCRYCKGKGTCWACNGTGRIENWDFYNNNKKN